MLSSRFGVQFPLKVGKDELRTETNMKIHVLSKSPAACFFWTSLEKKKRKKKPK